MFVAECCECYQDLDDKIEHPGSSEELCWTCPDCNGTYCSRHQDFHRKCGQTKPCKLPKET